MRERVFGIETEYALIYHPRPGDPERPTNLQIYRRFEAEVQRRLHSLPNSFSPFRAKMGRFLENGCTFQYEATAEHYEHGLIEMASPECRDPITLIHYERAKDELVEELAVQVGHDLELQGYRGHLRIGKNNVDSQGHTFGSHENYWVEDPLPPVARSAFFATWLLLWSISLPVLAFVAAVQIMAIVALLLSGVTVLASATLLAVLRPAAARRFLGWLQRISLRLASRPGSLARWIQRLVAPMYPLIALHSAVYNRFHFRKFRDSLTAFLVTRSLYCGAGAIRFDGGPLLHIAQRPPFLRTLSRIFPEGDERPLFETRELFFRPWSALRARRRLHLLLGDANLCEWAQLLRVGATALVLESIESGIDFPWPRLEDPIDSLRRVGRDESLRLSLQLVDGSTASALEIQRVYLAGVERALGPESSLEPWKRQVIGMWRETLDLLERDPDLLADRVDWIAKRRLLHGVVADPRDREILRDRGAAILREDEAQSPEDRRLRDLAYRLWRADLRYHELSPRGGYRRLEARRRIWRLTNAEALERARRSPPTDTRAWARGEAIRWAHSNALPGAAAWHRVRVGKLGWRWFTDPLDPGRRVPPRRG